MQYLCSLLNANGGQARQTGQSFIGGPFATDLNFSSIKQVTTKQRAAFEDLTKYVCYIADPSILVYLATSLASNYIGINSLDVMGHRYKEVN